MGLLVEEGLSVVRVWHLRDFATEALRANTCFRLDLSTKMDASLSRRSCARGYHLRMQHSAPKRAEAGH